MASSAGLTRSRSADMRRVAAVSAGGLPSIPDETNTRTVSLRGSETTTRTMRGPDGSCKLQRSASFVELGDVSDDGRRRLTCQETKDLFRRMVKKNHNRI
ncbi:hypothetical protein BD626DRAFT_510143 [Schizophyllum amplum]|uniref:Uncharacterized protein n=1 Tax=Schizophyllum amplum TaxID=97359 RepID=A0A550C296_9AGAR|nr:hypothetical protein BD626DRAFT_510143 [Auriculariopsis ampla]